MATKTRSSKTKTVHIGFLIDESGSMSGNRASVVEGYNQFLRDLQSEESEKECKTTLAFFDDRTNAPRTRIRFDGVPLEETTELGFDDYLPMGMTPLNDAIVDMIGKLDKGAKKDDEVMVVIMTDGLENASETTTEAVNKMVKEKEKAGWLFIYLGANQDSFAVAQSYGIQASANYASTPSGTGSTMSSVASVGNTLRTGTTFDAHDHVNALAGQIAEDPEVQKKRDAAIRERIDNIKSEAKKARKLL